MFKNPLPCKNQSNQERSSGLALGLATPERRTRPRASAALAVRDTQARRRART